MPKIYVKLNEQAVRQYLLKGPVAGICLSIAQQKASAAGPGYAAKPVNYPERTGAIVYPGTQDAINDNYDRNTLEKMRGG